MKYHLEKNYGYPLGHGVGVSQAVVVVQYHDCANNTAGHLGSIIIYVHMISILMVVNIKWKSGSQFSFK